MFGDIDAFKQKAKLILLLLAIVLVLSGIFFILDQQIGFYATFIAFLVITVFKFKAGPAFIHKDKESLFFKYTKWKEKHYLLSVFLLCQVVFVIFSLMIIISRQFQLVAFIVVLVIGECSISLGLYIRKQLYGSSTDDKQDWAILQIAQLPDQASRLVTSVA